LPLDRMAAHGVERGALEHAARHAGPLPSGYVELMEELLGRAEDDYRQALPAVAALPDFFQRPVAVSAHLYRGIHGAIRRNGHNTLTRRAFTTMPRKGILTAGALLHLRRIRMDHRAAGSLATSPPWRAREGSGEAA